MLLDGSDRAPVLDRSKYAFEMNEMPPVARNGVWMTEQPLALFREGDLVKLDGREVLHLASRRRVPREDAGQGDMQVVKLMDIRSQPGELIDLQLHGEPESDARFYNPVRHELPLTRLLIDLLSWLDRRNSAGQLHWPVATEARRTFVVEVETEAAPPPPSLAKLDSSAKDGQDVVIFELAEPALDVLDPLLADLSDLSLEGDGRAVRNAVKVSELSGSDRRGILKQLLPLNVDRQPLQATAGNHGISLVLLSCFFHSQVQIHVVSAL